MKKVLLLIIFITNLSLSQEISYIIPDVGAPGMNTYVEIIAPYDANGGFGADGFFLNNPGDIVRVELVRSADASKITFGPIIISWDGRLISSQVFVYPDVVPNSEYWYELRNEFRIPFRIVVNGSFSNIDTFYIVKPFNIGDLRGTAHWEIGGGRIGLRSRRGAMIIDSAIFSNNTYGISMDDCDPFIDGNQAYLPFIMLAQGNIQGEGSNSNISADTDTKHGGPGGGGGGGKFCDAYLLNPGIIGEDGGDGFTGGGPGGRNNSGGGNSNEFKNAGTGTGADGTALNGQPPAQPAAYESSGGGTGHPFGLSGYGCQDGYNCDPDGGYGGGSGYQQTERGGSAGYRSVGNSTGTNNGGQIYGNIDGIPIAGGSGGASGNPRTPGACSGNGGGGGGAVRVFAEKINQLSISADGADGAGSSSGAGGAGSGGYIEISTKLSVINSNLSAEGGNNGRAGRGLLRIDSPFMFGMNYSPTGVERGRGLTTDTSRSIYKYFTLTGSKNQAIDSVRLYIKSEGSFWQLDTVLAGLRGVSKWSRDYYLPGPDSIYFICAVADRQYSERQQYTNVLQYTMSQAAANILFKNKTPEIMSDSVRELRMLACPGSFIEDTFMVYNKGDAGLRLEFNSASFLPGNQGFSLIQPGNVSWVLPSDSIPVIVRYTFQAGQSGRITDTLFIAHNDIFANNNPYKIVYSVTLDSLDFNITNQSLVDIDVLNFGEFCIGDSSIKSFRIVNKSSIDLKITDVIEGNPGFVQLDDLSLPIEVGKYSVGKIRFIPDKVGWFNAKLIISSDSCDAVKDTLSLVGSGVSAEFAFKKPINTLIDTLDLGEHCVGGAISTYFLVENRGGQHLTFNRRENIVKPDYDINIHSRGLIPKNHWDTVYFDFWPKKEGYIEAKIGITTSECSGFTDSLVIICYGVYADLSYSGSGNFGVVSNDIRDTITTWLTNSGTADVIIETLKPLAPPFSYIYIDPPLPVVLKPTEKLRVDIEFYPRTDGFYRDTVMTNNILTDTTCIDDDEYPLRGISTGSQLILSTDTLDYEVLEFCDAKLDSVEISNPTTVVVTLSNPRIIGPDNTYFEISQAPSSNIIPIGGSVWYHITFRPKLGPAGVKVAQFAVNTDFPKNPEMIVELRGEQENLRINMTPPDYTFGTVPIGVQRVQTIKLTNNGKIDQNLIDVKLANPDMTASPKAAFLAANGGFVDVDVTYKPTTAGNADTEVWFIFRKNCTDSIMTNIYAEGKEGQVLVTSRVLFELNPPCSDVIDSTLEVINTGASLVVIDSMVIGGPDRALFTFADTVNLPNTLDSAGILNRIIRFSPGNSPYGLKSAYIVTYTNVGGKTKTDTTQLSAEKKKFLTITPQLLDFSNVVVSQSKELNFRLANVGNSQLTITALIPPAYATEYIIIPSPVGTVILPGQFVDFIMRFTPSTTARFDDQFGIEAEYITACKDSTFANMTGSGIPQLDTRIIISNLYDVDPRYYEVNIPVTGYITNPDTKVEDLEFRALISYNVTLFALKSFRNATILRDSIYQNSRFIEFEIKGLILDNDTTIIANLIGRPLLGNAESTTINWEEFSWKDSLAFGITDTIPGELGIKVCKEGGARLLNPGIPLTMSIAPNPAGEKISVELTLLEVGLHTIDIYDVKGICTNLARIEVSIEDNKKISLNFSLSQFSAGFYYIILNSPTNRIIKPIFIIK